MTQNVETERFVKVSYFIKVHEHETKNTLNDLAHLWEYEEKKSSLMIVAHVNCGHQILATFHVSVGTAAAVRYGLTQHEDFY